MACEYWFEGFISIVLMIGRGSGGKGSGWVGTVIRAVFFIGLVSCYVEDFALILVLASASSMEFEVGMVVR